MKLINDSLYIVPNNIRRDLLLELSKENELKNIKFMSLNEVVDRFGYYEEDALYYLMKNYKYKYKNAKIILENIRYVDNKKYDNNKLDNLVKIKNELDEFYKVDELFLKELNHYSVYVYGYDYIDSYSRNILDKINSNFLKPESNDYKHTIYEFEDMFSEVSFIASSIRDLLDQGIDINKIKIVNYSDEYYFIMNTVFNMHNITINLKNESIYSTNICQKFLSEKDYELGNDYISNKIISVINKYLFIEDEDIKREIYINEFKNIKLDKKYENAVELVNLSEVKEDEYAFLIGFNDGVIPRIYKDEDYLSDKEKEIIGLDKSFEITSELRSSTVSNIKSIKNMVISYKLKSTFNDYGISNLNEELGYDIEIGSKYNYSYSISFNNLLLGIDIDNYIKYLDYSDELELLFNNYKSTNYNTFSNEYKKISKDKLYEYLKNKLTLSYSSMDTFYKCKFRYYLNSILKLDKYEETFAIYIGNLFHYVLSKAFEPGFDFNKEYNSYIERELTIKEEFFINKLKDELVFIIDTIKKQYSHSNFKNAIYENKFSINKDSSIKVDFIGYIDKLLYEEYNGKTLLVIIDYKTGTQDFNLSNSIYGLNMQLPVYLYLSKNGDIKNAEVVGMYLQKILNNEIKKDPKKTYTRLKEEQLKLTGYSLYDEEYLNEFDDSYEHSEVIKSLSKTKDGFSSYSKLLTKEQMDELYKLTDKKIDNARDEILDCNFDIDPKRIGFNNVSCTYCKYKDICFMKEDNIKILDEVKDLDFLGGDINA